MNGAGSADLLTLERIDDGSYGACERCGAPIGRERLFPRPAATLCRMADRA